MTESHLTGRRAQMTNSDVMRFVQSSSDREKLRGLRATIELAPIGICHFDVNGQFLLVNERLCEVLGYTRDALLARCYQDICHPADADACLRVIGELVAGTRHQFHGESRFVRADGGTVWARLSVATVRDERGNLAFLTGVAEDVSEERANERARREAEERLRAALEASSTGTYRWDLRNDTVAWDSSLHELFGVRQGQSVTSLDEFLALIHPDDRRWVAAAAAECAESGTDMDAEFRIIRPDGAERWIYDKGRVFLDSAGRPAYMTGACIDVTAHHAMARELRASEARLRRIVESGMVGVFYCTADHRITGANAAFLRMLGYTREDVAAGTLIGPAITPERFRALDSARLREAMATGFTPPWEKELIARDGRTIPVLVAAARLDDAGEQYIGISLDISESKAAETERERLLAAEHEARMHAEWAKQRRDEVLGIVAHDLRSPVHTIVMSASALTESAATPEQLARHLGIIGRAARSMERLIRDLLDVGRLEAGTLEVRHEPVQVAPLLADVAEAFEADGQAAGLAIAYDVAPELPVVSGDRDRLLQVLTNLIGNALKFTPRGGRIAVHAHHVGSHVEIAVTDDGPGIPPRILSTVFERFWQADRTSRSGAGLGLAIARGIVEAHGGHIWVESIVGHGTAFRFTIPTIEGAAPTAD